MWVQAELVSDPVQLDLGCTTCSPYPEKSGKRTTTSVPRVGSRSALKLAVRMPYYVVPFDLLLLAPVLMFTSPEALQSVVFASAGGGLLTIQRRWDSGIGTFQFMAGREIGLTLWGYTGHTNEFIYTPGASEQTWGVATYNSLEWDFPVFEYVPPRVFATTLALAAEIQAGFSVEFPNNVALRNSTAPFNLGPSWLVYLRFRLDARKYFGGASD
jgi:hypothetical protein